VVPYYITIAYRLGKSKSKRKIGEILDIDPADGLILMILVRRFPVCRFATVIVV